MCIYMYIYIYTSIYIHTYICRHSWPAPISYQSRHLTLHRDIPLWAKLTISPVAPRSHEERRKGGFATSTRAGGNKNTSNMSLSLTRI